jgi:hypothetical protein
MSPPAVKTAQSDEQHRRPALERFKLEHDHARSLVLDARTVGLRGTESGLPQLTRLVAEHGRMRRRLHGRASSCRSRMPIDPNRLNNVGDLVLTEEPKLSIEGARAAGLFNARVAKLDLPS